MILQVGAGKYHAMAQRTPRKFVYTFALFAALRAPSHFTV
jgi:hypothetical protein